MWWHARMPAQVVVVRNEDHAHEAAQSLVHESGGESGTRKESLCFQYKITKTDTEDVSWCIRQLRLDSN